MQELSPAETHRCRWESARVSSEGYFFQRRFCHWCDYSFSFGLRLGTKGITHATELKFRHLERCQDIVLHVEGTNALDGTADGQLLSYDKSAIIECRKQPVAVGEPYTYVRCFGDGVDQGYREELLILVVDHLHVSNASVQYGLLEVRELLVVRHLS